MQYNATHGAGPAPPGVTPDFDHPESRGYQVIIVAIISPIIALCFLVLRLYTKSYILRRLQLDDYAIVLAWLFALVYSILQIVETRYGSGVHIWNVTKETFVLYNKIAIPAGTSYSISTLFTKLSILLLYQRFSIPGSGSRLMIYVISFIVTGYSFASGVSFLWLCQPIKKEWDYSTPGKCVELGTSFLAIAILNSASDVVLLLLPMLLLRPLRLPFKQKVGVTLILMTGSFVCAVSFVRVAEIPPGENSTDGTWEYITNLIWCMIEMYTGIICACLPSLRTFCKHHFPKIFNQSDDFQSVLTGWTMSRPEPTALRIERPDSCLARHSCVLGRESSMSKMNESHQTSVSTTPRTGSGPDRRDGGGEHENGVE